MAGFLYLKKGQSNPINDDMLKDWNLDPILNLSQAPCREGMLFCDGALLGEAQFAYVPDRQNWIDIGNGLSIGYFTDDDRPTPKERLRKDAMRGHLVTLGDGNDWLVPIARQWTSVDPPAQQIALPAAFQLNFQTGEWEASEIVPKYQRLWEICEQFSDHQVAEIARSIEGVEGDEIAQVSLTMVDALPLACEVLAVNYDLTPIEISALGLMQSDIGPVDVLLALIDQPTFDDLYQKKTGYNRDGALTSNGGTD